ncbi:uncharacterized protein NEMAJ01_0334 [Nematocida major]|uniref:uncharacterized protein n=1 Tax=Nematocida major TaxID=1912982 RepID=UPI002007E6A7|nr:uncharacterized protein NEMAJ01_0334 [Nematocida major]KAH9385438.1 hypothetical protein NEMAJ01_0334 [Nematocida major]
MDSIENGKKYREDAKKSSSAKRRRETDEESTGYSMESEHDHFEWEKGTSMQPFNILAKCAAKELRELTKSSYDKENNSLGDLESDSESDLLNMEFPCAMVGGKKVYKCTFQGCNKSFPSLSRMRRHYIIHTGAKPFKCLNSKCNKTFSRRDNMIQHYKGHCLHTNV